MVRANTIHVFACGMLRAGEANNLRVAAAKRGILKLELLGTTTLYGRPYSFGAYPSLVLDSTSTTIHSDMYHIDAVLVPVLDEIREVYSGGDVLFLHENHPVMLDSEPIDCIVYPVDPQHIVGRSVITDGGWVAHRPSRG